MSNQRVIYKRTIQNPARVVMVEIPWEDVRKGDVVEVREADGSRILPGDAGMMIAMSDFENGGFTMRPLDPKQDEALLARLYDPPGAA